MHKRSTRFAFVPFIVLSLLSPCWAQSLKVATANIWSGLDYLGVLSVGEYESPEVRNRRLRILVDELRSLEPDVISLQEVNPVSSIACALAEELGYDVIYERANGGLKILRFGIPWNLNEGLATLAKKELRLEFVGVWDLSVGFGLFGNGAALHASERNIALVGRVRIRDKEVFVANVHLSAAVPDDSTTRAMARSIAVKQHVAGEDINSVVADCFADATRRRRSLEMLTHLMNERSGDAPFVVMGDFNATPTNPDMSFLISEARFVDVVAAVGRHALLTWDPEKNPNIRYSTGSVDAEGHQLDVPSLLSAWYDGQPRRIDYVFLNERFRSDDVLDARVILDMPEGDLFASDHYGLLATVNVSSLKSAAAPEEEAQIAAPVPKFEALPILSYDTDVGFGYGAKAFFLNFLGMTESLDLVAFNSTKGERWYRLVFSLPDFELRQGRVYPFSFDLTVDYDKYLKNNFYGIGSNSAERDRETYTKEPLEVLGLFSRGFSARFVAQFGLKYRTVRNFNYQAGGAFATSLSSINHGHSSAVTLCASARYDSRDSYINPSRGQVAQLDFETGGSWLTGDYSITSATLALQTYHVLFYPRTVFAGRIRAQSVGGSDLPVHALVSVGGTRNLRGYPQDRFLDKAAAVVNAEVRFPIFWRFGGVLGLDAGKVFRSPSEWSSGKWSVNSVAGLRFYMDTFVVRADVGFGRETTGFYLNFGHLF